MELSVIRTLKPADWRHRSAMTHSDPRRDPVNGAGDSWTLKGVDLKTLEIARDVARRSGVTTTELLHQLIANAGRQSQSIAERAPTLASARASLTEPARSSKKSASASPSSTKKGNGSPVITRSSRHVPAIGNSRLDAALAAVAGPADVAERRAKKGREEEKGRSLGLDARLEDLEPRLTAVAALLQSVLTEMRESQENLCRRLEHMEAQGRLSQAAGEAFENDIGLVAARLLESEGRAEIQALQFRASLRELRRRVDDLEAQSPQEGATTETAMVRVEARMDVIEAALLPGVETAAIDLALSNLTEQVESGRRHSLTALRELGNALATLEQFVAHSMPGSALPTTGGVASTGQVTGPTVPECADQGRLDGGGLKTDGPHQAAPSGLEASPSDARTSTDTAFHNLTATVLSTERRAAEAISRMSDDVVCLALLLDDRVGGVERRSGQFIGEVGAQVARIAEAVDECITSADDAQAATLNVLSGMIAEVADQLAGHIKAPERKGAHNLAQNLAEGVGGASGRLRHANDKLTAGLKIDVQRIERDPAVDDTSTIGDARVSSNSARQNEPAVKAIPPAGAGPLGTFATRHETLVLDMLCERLPSAPQNFDELSDTLELLEIVSANPPCPPIGLAEKPFIENGQPVSAAGGSRRPGAASPSPPPSVPFAQAGANKEVPVGPAGVAPHGDIQARVRDVDSFLSEQLQSLSAPRFVPLPVPEPPTPPSANRDLIESARAAARLKAESERRSPLEVFTARSEKGVAGADDVLELRNGFGLLRPRLRKS